MAIVPPLLSHSGLLEVLVGTSDNSVLVVHESDLDTNVIEDQLLQQKIGAAITRIAVAPNGRYLACYRRDGVLTVMASAFTTKVCSSVATDLALTIDNVLRCGCRYWTSTPSPSLGRSRSRGAARTRW